MTGTVAEWIWLLPVLPLLGFVINGLFSLNGARVGPPDPNMPDHHPHSEGAAEAPAILGGGCGPPTCASWPARSC